MIPTAEEFIFDYSQNDIIDNLDEESKGIIILKMKEFAKLHVEAALKEVIENATTVNKSKFKGDINYVVDEDSILNAYPLENIK